MFTATFSTAAELNHLYLVIDHETYAAIEGTQTPADPMLEDVAGLTVAASPEEGQRIEQWMRDISSEFLVQFVDPDRR